MNCSRSSLGIAGQLGLRHFSLPLLITFPNIEQTSQGCAVIVCQVIQIRSPTAFPPKLPVPQQLPSQRVPTCPGPSGSPWILHRSSSSFQLRELRKREPTLVRYLTRGWNLMGIGVGDPAFEKMQTIYCVL